MNKFRDVFFLSNADYNFCFVWNSLRLSYRSVLPLNKKIGFDLSKLSLIYISKHAFFWFTNPEYIWIVPRSNIYCFVSPESDETYQNGIGMTGRNPKCHIKIKLSLRIAHTIPKKPFRINIQSQSAKRSKLIPDGKIEYIFPRFMSPITREPAPYSLTHPPEPFRMMN